MKLRRIIAIMMMLLMLCAVATAEEATEGAQGDLATHTSGEGAEYLPEPTVKLQFTFEGDQLTEGTKMTIRAIVENIPENATYTLQWQNDITGSFTDLPGETGDKIEMRATKENVTCYWRVLLHVVTEASEE